MILILIGVLTFLLYIYDRQRLNHWKRKGVKQLNTVPFFGNFFQVFFTKTGKNDVYVQAHKDYPNEKCVGIYEYYRPVLVVRDLDMIQKIMIKDFSHFTDHPDWVFDKECFMHQSLFNLKGDLWRALRYQMTPAFSAGRLKKILPRLEEVLELPDPGFLEMREYIDVCSADSIAALFGTTITDKKDFQRIVKALGDVNLSRFYKIVTIEHFPSLRDFLGLSLLPQKIDGEFRNVASDFINYNRSEFASLLLDLKSKGSFEMKSKDFDSRGMKDGVQTFDATESLLLGQASIFLTASLDTTANSISFVVFDLCQNIEKQTKAAKEVKKILKRYKSFTYEALREMNYLGACIKESMRLHPVFPFAFREVTKEYKFEDGPKLDVGEKIIISSLSIHKDSEYFPDPEKFIPERWLEGNEMKKCTWLPFGEGPRQCLAMRYSQLKMKMIIGKLINCYEVTFDEKMKLPLELEPFVFIGEMKNELYTQLSPR